MVTITNEMTLEEKLNLIDEAMLVDPQEQFICDGCE